MAEKQLIGKLEKERTTLRAQQAAIATRLAVLDDALSSLRALTGEAPRRSKGSATATGTKALILDVLADGKRRTLKDLATGCKVAPSALNYHLAPLCASGDVTRQGKSRATTYGIP